MSLARCQLTIQDENGTIVDGADVEVRSESPGAPQASLFSDRVGSTPLGNSFTASDGADAGFFVAGGLYKITATKGGFTRTWRYVPVGTAQEYDVENLAPAGVVARYIAAGEFNPRITNGPSRSIRELTTNKNMRESLDFDASTQEFASALLRLPESWDGGTITFMPIWSHGSTVTNFGVVWGMDAVSFANGDASDAAYGTPQTSADTGGTTDTIYFGPQSSAITIAGTPAAGELIDLRIHRDPSNGSDTLAIDARLLGVVVYFTTQAATDA